MKLSSFPGISLLRILNSLAESSGKVIFLCLFFIFCFSTFSSAQVINSRSGTRDIEKRIKAGIDTMRIVDSHEHLLDPAVLKGSNLLDFSLLLFMNSFDDMMAAGMSYSDFRRIYFGELTPSEKWNIIEPYWGKSLNTNYNRLVIKTIKNLYNINSLDSSTVNLISEKISKAYAGNWFEYITKDLCRIDYLIQDDNYNSLNYSIVRYTNNFNSWITLRRKYTIDSIAVSQVDPIFKLDDLVNSMKSAFDKAVLNGIVAVKFNYAYWRSLDVHNYNKDEAKKIFQKLVNGNEDMVISYEEAKPLQDYLIYRLLEMCEERKIPVAFHTGFLAGRNRVTSNSEPYKLINLISTFPGINFILFHGAYPYGGQLTTLAKNYPNVYIDLNWMFAISPTYAEQYLNEWIETIPASKIILFGGDQRIIDNTYSQLQSVKTITAKVLSEKVSTGYFSEKEALDVARMIFHDNAVRLYNLK